MNITWSKRILETLYHEGVRDIVFCAGARNSPLIAVLGQCQLSSGFQLHSFFEERSASFYALGIARRTGRPVGVITTSGTAVAELFPAVIEAFHTGVPLILITADRPRRLRGTGAPQAIDQSEIFGRFVGQEFDLENGVMFSTENWNRRTPLHLNLCFDEPLLDEAVEPLILPGLHRPAEGESFRGQSPFQVSSGSEWAMLRLTRFLRGSGPLLVVVGTLECDEEREAVAQFLSRLQAPVYLESTSGLREHRDLKSIALRSGDRVLSWALKKGLISRVLRLGGVPTVRIWRDLEEKSSPIEVFSLTALPFSGLSRGEMVCARIAPALRDLAVTMTPNGDSGVILAKDRAVEAGLLSLFEAEPDSEPAMVRALSKLISKTSFVYIGNSLPIREWDLAASHDHSFAVAANRGVNGIDGQLSTFLGMAPPGAESWALVGDLTALYDLTAPWALRTRHDLVTRLVVLNNSGGKIFSRVLGAGADKRTEDLFVNQHDLSFDAWATMWKLGYQKWTRVPERFSGSAHEVIEMVPDQEATQRFWAGYENLWL